MSKADWFHIDDYSNLTAMSIEQQQEVIRDRIILYYYIADLNENTNDKNALRQKFVDIITGKDKLLLEEIEGFDSLSLIQQVIMQSKQLYATLPF